MIDNAIAVVGLAMRVPGASNEETLWDNLRRGHISLHRYDAEALKALGGDPARLSDPTYVPVDGRLLDADQFDADRFGISQREADRMDPQHRLLLECGWELLQRTGYGHPAHRPVTGVFAGASMNTYLPNVLQDTVNLVSFAGTEVMLGNDKDYLTTRLSYKLGLTGPSYAVQTGCSTSLVAVHLACQSLLAGECDLALAGGVAVYVGPPGYTYVPGLMFSPDGRCRAFDADAAGTPFGDGVGLVALRRLEDAVADGDHIRAVIRGTATNNDGAQRVGFTAPSVDGQRSVIAEAHAVAQVDPQQIRFVEAHGTGTPLGDPIEFQALCEVFGRVGPRKHTALGTVKANVGHLAAAAGVAGLIKAVLTVEAGEIPPHPTFQRPHPQLDMENSQFYVNVNAIGWPQPGPRHAGVSSFGAGGTNAHVVLESAPARFPRGKHTSTQILPLSARTPAELISLARRTARVVAETSLPLDRIAETLQRGREHEPVRLAVVGDTLVALADALAAAEPSVARASRLLLVLGFSSNDEAVAFWRSHCGAAVTIADPWTPSLVSNAHAVVCIGVDAGLRAEVRAASLAVGAMVTDADGTDGQARALAAVFAAGVTVNWPAADPSSGRCALPYPDLKRRRCWLREREQTPPLASEGIPSAARLHVEMWQRGGPVAPRADVAGSVWILADRGAVGVALAERLRAKGTSVAVRGRGDNAGEVPSGARVVCLWGLEGPFDPIGDTQALYTLAHQAAARGGDGVDLIGRGLFDVIGDEHVDAERSSMVGLRAVLSQELGQPCRVFDIGEGADAPETVHRWLADAQAPEVGALRHGRLWRERFTTLQDAAESPISLTGTCLITGGTGSVGAALGEALARRDGVALLLLGRTPLPPRNDWPALAERLGDATMRARLARLVALDRAGVRFEVLAVDVADRSALDGAIAHAARTLGPVRSFVHAAGPEATSATTWRDHAGIDHWRAVMAGKVEGARHLHGRLGGSELELGLFVSSLAGIAGGLGLAAYAASNRFLDGLVQQHRDLPYAAIDFDGWTTWEAVDGLSHARRAAAMTPAEACEAFVLALAHRGLRRIAVSRTPVNQRTAADQHTDHALPSTPATEVATVGLPLASLWEEVLGVSIDPEANFFDLGGDSLIGVELIRKVNQTFGTRLVISDLFDAPSVVAMTARIEEGKAS